MTAPPVGLRLLRLEQCQLATLICSVCCFAMPQFRLAVGERAGT